MATSLADSGGGMPLLEVAATGVDADVRSTSGRGIVACVQGSVQSNVFSHTRLGWEPVVERWPFVLKVERSSEE